MVAIVGPIPASKSRLRAVVCKRLGARLDRRTVEGLTVLRLRG